MVGMDTSIVETAKTSGLKINGTTKTGERAETGDSAETGDGIESLAQSWASWESWTSDDSWASCEFGDAELGDARRTMRLVQLAKELGARPSASLPDATDGCPELKAAYRFFDNKAIPESAILQSHVAATYDRLRHVPLVLGVQDTSLLDFTSHPATTGLGPLASAYQHGLVMHSTLCFTPERVPLGLLAQKVWNRDPDTCGQQVDHKERPIEEKESIKWLESLDALILARTQCPDTDFISVGDRESDVYDLFLKERPEGVDVLVRAAWDRRVEHPEQYLWKAMTTVPTAAEITVRVPKRKGLPARKKSAARPEQPAREATLKVVFRPITLHPPRARRDDHLPSIDVYAVWAIEIAPSGGLAAGTEPVEWMLLTTRPVHSAEEALEKLEWYACRWGIEVWHKVLKSGCRIEAKQFETAERIKRCLAVYSVIAWRILFATMLCREVPDLPCTVLLEEDEWKALYCKIHRRPTHPPQPPDLRTAVRWIASLGGFLNRKHDGEPGVTVLWKGFQHLADLSSMYHIMTKPPQRSLI